MSYKIYPAIGIARVGNAPDKFYIDPETYRSLPENPDGSAFTQADFRDDSGRLCRQAARFRIYREENGLAELITLDSDNIESITWTVHIANKKPSWYEFQTSQGEHGYASTHPLRNASVTGDDRLNLMIDAGPRSIAGSEQSGVHFNADSAPEGYDGVHFPDGDLQPLGIPIDTLGELRTAADGSLLVLGGLGHAGTTNDTADLPSYANNDNWWDDTSDGPVKATITFNNGDAPIDVDPAYVLVGPPSYVPEIPNLVSLYDTIFDAHVRAGRYSNIQENGFWKSGENGYNPNFQTEIKPLLERATLYPWVAAIPPKPHEFDMDRLGDAGEASRGLRHYILDVLRPPNQENTIVNSQGATMMPYLAGDNCLKPESLPSNYLRITYTQYFFLQQWADGYFVNETPSTVNPDPQAITRQVLENCVGGAFSPGIEMSWISRNAAIYSDDDPFRINGCFPEMRLSLGFDPKIIEPGDITRYMAIPWQADFNQCSYQPMGDYDRVLWWWPPQRPEFVYLDKDDELALKSIPDVPNIDSGTQVPWIGTGYDQKAGNFISFADSVDMVKYWCQLGFVMEKTIDGEQRFVEVARTLPRPENLSNLTPCGTESGGD